MVEYTARNGARPVDQGNHFGPTGLLSVSPVPLRVQSDGRGLPLPLNLIAMIIAQLDDLGDLARLTRTSRVLYYMALPQLYESVTLRSYPEVRRVNGRVEGIGSASPMCMALNGLSTTQCAAFVKHFCLTGIWKETEEYKQGRIPDSTMLLSIVVRNAVEKMTNLQSFRWELNTKPIRTVYQGLVNRPSLTSLTLQFPISRTPRQVTSIPPLPNLRSLSVIDLDPLCYNDDLAVLLLHAKRLEVLKMHWNPRMRLEAEASTNLATYFGRCIQAGHRLAIRKFGMHNFYGANNLDIARAFDFETMREAHFLDVFGGVGGAPANAFIDDTWRDLPDYNINKWKVHRSNELAFHHTKILSEFEGLEELYLINQHLDHTGGKSSDEVASPVSESRTPSNGRKSPDSMPSNLANLGGEYINVITRNHGATLRKLLLPDRFRLSVSDLATLVRCCPNIEQLGLAIGENVGHMFGHLLPFLPKLFAVRVADDEFMRRNLQSTGKQWMDFCDEIGRDIYLKKQDALRWCGVGDQYLYVGDKVEVELEDGTKETRRELHEVTCDDVKHIEIWAMDTLVL